MPSRHTPLQRRFSISRRLLRLIACGHLAALALACMTASAQAGTATPDPSPSALRPDPFPIPASRPAAVAPSPGHLDAAVSTRSPIQGQTQPLAQRTVARPASGSEARPRAPQRPPVVRGSRDGAGSHTPRRTIERPKGSFASAVGKANGSARTALRTVSPLELGVAATLLALLALAGFSLAASVVRLEGKG